MYVCICAMFICCHVNSQTFISTQIDGVHLNYNKLGGIQLTTDLIRVSKKNIIQVSGFICYSTGKGSFDYEPGKPYSLLDGANRDQYPLYGIVPGLPENAYIKVLALNTSKSVENGLAFSYGRVLIDNDKIILNAKLGICLSWIEESSVAYAYEGDLTNVLGTISNINLVIPFTLNYFDIGPKLSTELYFVGKESLSFGISGEITWLGQTGYKYSLGPTILIKI